MEVKRLINEHLIDLGINPKVPPVELFSEKFMEHVNGNAGGNAQAKASEMEHAIRKHCTVHMDEDPAFYASLSEKLEDLMQKHSDDWDAQVEAFAKLREEALAGRAGESDPYERESTIFRELLLQLAYPEAEIPADEFSRVEKTAEVIVAAVRDRIGILDFWKKSVEVKKLRGSIDTELLLSAVRPFEQNSERLATELVKLAEKRHTQILEINHA